MSRTRRRSYQKSRRFDATCRSHGGCPWCEGNRLHRAHRWLRRAHDSLLDYFAGVES